MVSKLGHENISNSDFIPFYHNSTKVQMVKLFSEASKDWLHCGTFFNIKYKKVY